MTSAIVQDPSDGPESVGSQTADGVSAGHPAPGDRFETLVAAFEARRHAQQRFHASRDPRELDAAVDAAMQAIDHLCEGEDAKRATWQGMAAVSLLARAEADHNATDLDEAINLAQVAITSGVGDPSQRAGWLSTLGISLAKRFRWQHVENDLEAALLAAREAVATVPETDRNFPIAASDLLVVLLTSFDAKREAEELAEAIEMGRKSVAHLTPDDPMLPMYQSRLEAAEQRRAAFLQQSAEDLMQGYNTVVSGEASVSRRELDRVIFAAEDMMPLLEPQHPWRGPVLVQLGELLLRRFVRSTALADLDDAIEADRELVGLLPVDAEMRMIIFERLTGSLRMRFEAAPDAEARGDTIAIARALAAGTPRDDPAYAASRLHLAVMVAEDARRSGDRTRIAEAVEAAEEAVGSGQLTGIKTVEGQCVLAAALWAQAEYLGSVNVLDRAIGQVESAIAIASTGVTLGFLGSLLGTRAALTGSGRDLDAAIDRFESAIRAYGDPGQSGEPPPGLSEDLGNLGLCYLRRYEHLGALADLNAGVDRGRAAVRLSADGDFASVGALGNLAYSLARRFDRLGDDGDLDECIELFKRAVGLLNPGIAGLSFLRGNLAAALLLRGRRDDIDLAIELIRAQLGDQALTAEVTANSQRNLCQALTRRFELDASLQDASDAIDAGTKAAGLAPAGSPAEANALHTLALAYLARYLSPLHLAQDQAAAISAFRRASSIAGSPPRQRALDAMRWADMAMDASRYADAVEGFSTSIELLGQVVPRRIERADQEHQLAIFTGIGSLAAACCLETGDVSRAIELWEHGRGVLASQQLDSRSDLTELAAKHAGLAERFSSLSAQLDRLGDGTLSAPAATPPPGAATQSPSPLSGDEQRAALARELTDCIEEIRAQPGFAGFLQAPPLQSLRRAAAGGPVVLLNVASLRADAIVMRDGGEVVVPLPGLTPGEVERRVRDFLSAVDTVTSRGASHAAVSDAAAVVTDTLRWMYDAIAAPVLDSLGYIAVPPDGAAWPRIWWCPSGLLSLLPLHAAGYHATEPADIPRTVIDRVVSSYTPTLRSLLHAQLAARTEPRPGPDQLVVSMPHTPGANDLPGAAVEAGIVKAQSPGRVTELIDSRATRERVLAGLGTHAKVHFACHASSNLNNPSASYLLLSDYQTSPLTVLEVARKRLAGDLAVLSACSTARPGTHLVDEVIHLTSGFQLAGYRHVVATMWPLADKLASVFAERMYSGLIRDGSFDPDLSALATHNASRAIRARYLDMPLIWAPFLHLGP